VLFNDRPRRTRFDGQRWLCRSELTSPFSANRPDTLARCNERSLKTGTKERIVRFIQKQVDSGLKNIELADRFNRFLVSHDGFETAPDLSSFGAGVRRVFELGLLFAGARGGVLLIDEFESAIHTELLADFARFAHELATDHNVQVFLSTHSKETVDAFILNDNTKDIVGYALNRAAADKKVKRYDGERLRKLHEAVDFDLRRVR